MPNNIECSRFAVTRILILFFITSWFCCAASDAIEHGSSEQTRASVVPIGVVLDLDSPLGTMADVCMEMAVSDFYAAHPNYSTRLRLHTKNAKSVLEANFAVLELLQHEEVYGIVGPQDSIEETFFAELGEKVHMPMISFTARTSTLSYKEDRYFVRATPDDAIQAQALATICQGFGWHEVVVLYEDTAYGNQFLSYMNNAFQEVEIRLAYMIAFPRSAEDSHLLQELDKLRTKQTRVFIVHMNPYLGFRLFNVAKQVGVMSEGFAWIITDSLSNFVNSMDSVTRDSMQGVLGTKPYISRSKDLESFQERWERNMILKNTTTPLMKLNAYGLWAYDAVTALAIAIENIAPLNSTLFDINVTRNGKDKRLRISTFGPQFLDELSRTKFRGLSGDFELVDGKLKQPAFQIFNVIGNGEKSVGYWTQDRGITKELNSTGTTMYSTSTKELKSITWPGDSVIRPKGWAIPATGKLRVGIPWKHGFTEFVDVIIDPATKHTNANGFSIDIFLATLELLPFPINYEFFHYNDTKNIDWSYDDMLHEIPQKFDMVVGDTTIWAPRAAYVDFSLPYSESGVILVVKNKKSFDMWIFVKPLRWDLWLAIIVACFLMGIVLHILEHRVTSKGTDSLSTNKERPRMVYWSPVAVLAFPEKQLHISASRLMTYSSAEDYHNAMSLGSKNKGIDAIFDEIPYMKLFLNKYDSQYKMVGPTYRTGFGFAFPRGSPLVSHFSKAIMDVTQGPNMTSIEQENFGPGYSSQDPLSSTISQQTSSLTLYDFAGLFLIIGSVTVFALFCSETVIGRTVTEKAENFISNCLHSKTSQGNSMENASVDDGDLGQGIEDEEIHEAVQDNVSNSREDTDVRVVGEVELHEIGPSIAQNLRMRTESIEDRNS
ncbi:UNVERIFIED_CONTAM: Glutamate receptor 2.8 [Sesamum radiatum]|uniref:Glutamate receptor n=1 Tax=Sesamum radiatum TaxID=300843 RepID=A0AAW2NAX7_SESRA